MRHFKKIDIASNRAIRFSNKIHQYLSLQRDDKFLSIWEFLRNSKFSDNVFFKYNFIFSGLSNIEYVINC